MFKLFFSFFIKIGLTNNCIIDTQIFIFIYLTRINHGPASLGTKFDARIPKLSTTSITSALRKRKRQ